VKVLVYLATAAFPPEAAAARACGKTLALSCCRCGARLLGNPSTFAAAGRFAAERGRAVAVLCTDCGEFLLGKVG
jgi:hypothetical protein